MADTCSVVTPTTISLQESTILERHGTRRRRATTINHSTSPGVSLTEEQSSQLIILAGAVLPLIANDYGRNTVPVAADIQHRHCPPHAPRSAS